jgi:UDP-N-acetylmuramoyl-L-alanyl-D-glutamate--2,6-diaminopimelate ligase
MRLDELLTVTLPGAELFGDGSVTVQDVVYDSRRVRPGSLFVAVAGQKSDGHAFLEQARSLGAAAVVVQSDRAVAAAGLDLPALVVPDSRAALASIAAALNGHPARRLGMIGVTGTDGKTTVCHLVDHILSVAGERAALITTAECRIGERPLMDTGRFTTPEAPELQAMLRVAVDTGCGWAVVEATSHGLALHRLDSCEFDIAASTVISSDHLDFHGSVEAYVKAKARLFEMLDTATDKGVPKTAVLNADDPVTETLRKATKASVLTYGLAESADVRATEVEQVGWGSRVQVETSVGRAEITVPKPGPFMVSTALAATGISLAAGLDLEAVARAIESWRGAPGRMEVVDEGQPFKVVVDFAHAPGSLERVLDVLRAGSRGRIIAVFGCIGERERDRRAAMGAVAAANADYTIVTDDNPYTEDRDAIIRDIVSGLEGAGKRRGHDFDVVRDRREAIAQALGMAVDEDVVLLAGKGHETTVHLGDEVYECDDRVVAADEVRRLTGSRAS